ncbi:MAG: hypothetical protein WC848_06400 [Parcubacteria group bacterium]|jgi:hypothetical protein
MENIINSRKRINRSIKKIGVALLFLFFALSSLKMPGTNSFFTGRAKNSGSSFSVGTWIPTLRMSVDIPMPEDEIYKTRPCVTLDADISGEHSGITIWYKFSDDGLFSEWIKYDEECVLIPDGNPTNFVAQAINDEQPERWKSQTVSGIFRVDTTAPVVRINAPAQPSDLSGTVAVRGMVTDAHPDHYWLVVENSSGTQIAGPGTVNDTSSFSDKKFFDWDTTKVPDGKYTIKLEARDRFGNKLPNQSPVLFDPNKDNDSVDWIEVNVKNSSAKASKPASSPISAPTAPDPGLQFQESADLGVQGEADEVPAEKNGEAALVLKEAEAPSLSGEE